MTASAAVGRSSCCGASEPALRVFALTFALIRLHINGFPGTYSGRPPPVLTIDR